MDTRNYLVDMGNANTSKKDRTSNFVLPTEIIGVIIENVDSAKTIGRISRVSKLFLNCVRSNDVVWYVSDIFCDKKETISRKNLPSRNLDSFQL